MKRKIVQHGPGTYTVSLPAEWVRKNKIKKGDEVEVEVGENEIRISSKKHIGFEKITIDATNLTSSQVIRRMKEAFVLGYDEIEVTSKKDKIPFTSRFRGAIVRSGEIDIKQLITFVKVNTIGFEMLLNNNGNYILKECVGKSSLTFEESVSQIIRHIDLMISHFSSKEKYGFEDFLDAAYFHKLKINSFSHFCQRMINKGELSTGFLNNAYYALICYLEKIGDMLYSTMMFSKNYSNAECKKLCLNLSVLSGSLKKLFTNSNDQNDYKKLKDIQMKTMERKSCYLCYIWLIFMQRFILSLKHFPQE